MFNDPKPEHQHPLEGKGGGTMQQAVDVLAVKELSPEHLRILKGLAQDTGAFRVNNKQASDIASACAAVLKAIESSVSAASA